MHCQHKRLPNEDNIQNISTSCAVTSACLTKNMARICHSPVSVMKSVAMIFMWQYNTHVLSFLLCIAFALDKKADAAVSLPPTSGEQVVNPQKHFLSIQEISYLPSNPNI